MEDIKEERSITKRYTTDGSYRGRNNNRVRHSRLGNTTHTNSIKGQRMNTYKQFLEDKEIPKGHHRMPDGSIMKNSDHSKKKDEELEERVGASAATQGKLRKPLDRQTANSMKLKVKNMASDLDYIAWKLENEIDMKNSSNLVKEIDRVMKEVKQLEKTLQKNLK